MSKSMTQTVAPAERRGPALVTLDGRYHIVERIASGGMGEVFRAHDAVLAREVAVKVLHRSLASDQGFVDRFRREARAAATLNHPNIVTVFDWGAVDGVYYMVMEYVHGRSVRDLINGHGRLAPAQAADVIDQTLLALEHAHAKGIVHRDLKPENMLVTTEGVVKLTDLGLARAFADAKATRAGQVSGTVQYLSPEQIRGEPADPRSDLYALGIVAYELLTGRLPFTGETPMAIAYQHLSGDVPAPSSVRGVPADLDAFVAAAVDKERELRPESARVMRDDLRAIEADGLRPAASLATLIRELPAAEPASGSTTAKVVAAITESIPLAAPPRRGRLRRVTGILALLIVIAAAAWGLWTYVLPHTAPVPAVTGATVEEATRQLNEAGFVVQLADGRYDMDVAAGHVLAVDPPEGTDQRLDQPVTLLPSLGPPPVRVPLVTGDDLGQAVAALRAEGFVPQIQRKHHDTVPEGTVIEQRPDHGKAPRGSSVTVIVSLGHAPVPVPRIVGKTQETAERALKDAGFHVIVRTAYSDDVPRGAVISVDPPEHEKADFGSSVTITVSQGPERFPAPDFRGIPPDQARALAEQWGLHPTFYYVPGTPKSVVISQQPDAGTTVHAGDTILLFVA
jgi:eukaryotic-like serine/threonine-protein kinase